MNAPFRHPPRPQGESADAIREDIQSKARRYAELMGHGSAAALLAGMARDHHLRSVPRGGNRR